jgi:hypothetical protein
MFTPEAGTWYIVVACEQCESTIFLFVDLNNGKGILEANYIVTCPQCSHKGGYAARHYYHSLEQHDSEMGKLSRP